MVLSKVAIVGISLVFKEISDILDKIDKSAVVVTISLFLLYGVLRLSGSLFNEVRDAIFSRVRYNAMRGISLRVLKICIHCHCRTTWIEKQAVLRVTWNAVLTV